MGPGECRHRLSVRTTTGRMVLPRIIQVLAKGRAAIDSLEMVRADLCGDDRITVVFGADAQRAALLASQLGRLVDVVEVRAERV
jgi:acetolactate synthase small subunit